MKRGLVRRQRKCINLMELVRSRTRYHPYISPRCSKRNSKCSRSRSRSKQASGYCNIGRKFNCDLPRGGFGLYFLRPTPPKSGSRSSRNCTNCADCAPPKRHISTSTHCRPVQRPPPAAAARSQHVDRAVNTQLTCRSIHTQYEPCLLVSVATSSLQLECPACAEHAALCSKRLESSNKNTATAATTTNTEEGQTPNNATTQAASTSTISLRASTVDRATSQAPLLLDASTSSAPSSVPSSAPSSAPSVPAQSRSESKDLLPPNIKLLGLGAEESTESDDEEEEDEHGSANEPSTSDNTTLSQSNLVLQVQQLNAAAGTAQMDTDGVQLADDEAGGDGHHNNSVIEIEITLRSGNDTNSDDEDDEDDEDEEEGDLVLDEESE